MVFAIPLHSDDERTRPSGWVLYGVTNVDAGDYLPLKLEFVVTDDENEVRVSRLPPPVKRGTMRMEPR